MRWLARALRNGIAVQTEEFFTISLLSMSVLAVEQLDHAQGIQREPLVGLARLAKVDRLFPAATSKPAERRRWPPS